MRWSIDSNGAKGSLSSTCLFLFFSKKAYIQYWHFIRDRCPPFPGPFQVGVYSHVHGSTRLCILLTPQKTHKHIKWRILVNPLFHCNGGHFVPYSSPPLLCPLQVWLSKYVHVSNLYCVGIIPDWSHFNIPFCGHFDNPGIQFQISTGDKPFTESLLAN